MATEFVKIRGSHYQLDHIIAVKKIKPFKDIKKRVIAYVVRLSKEAAGGDEDRFRNLWCTKAEVEGFLCKMKGLPEPIEEEIEEETVSSDVDTGLR